MKKFFVAVIGVFMLCPALWADVAVNTVNFPDAHFREYVSSNFDKDSNGVLSDAEIAAVKYINVGGYSKVTEERNMTTGKYFPVYEGGHNIASLKGIENFTSLLALDCSFNNLEAIDLSKLASLVYLNCSGNNITALDLSGNTKLVTLWCSINKLSSLSLKNNPSLREVYCWNNSLTEIDVSGNPELEVLFCSNNWLKTLDVSNNSHLWSMSCAKNDLKTLDLSHNTELMELYCHNNNLIKIDVSHNVKLTRLSCTNNQFGVLDINSNASLKALDGGGNYLVSLELDNNKALNELYVSGTTLRTIDISNNQALISFDCISNDMTTIDLSSNHGLQSVNCEGNSGLASLYITSSDNTEYPYQTDLKRYAGDNYGKVGSVTAFQYKKDDDSSLRYTVKVGVQRDGSTVNFDRIPHYIRYKYSTGYTGSASGLSVPKETDITINIDRNSFFYLPVPPSPDGERPPTAVPPDGVPSKVVSVDEYADFYQYSVYSASDNSGLKQAPEGETIEKVSSGGGSGGGCSSLAGLSALLAVVFFTRRKRSTLLAVLLVIALCIPAYAGVKASDYVLPIDYTIYDISGTWTTDFELTQELRDKILSEWDNSAVSTHSAAELEVHSFADIAMSGTWDILPADLYALSQTGEYGGVVLPLTQSGTGSNIYVIMCTFSSDIQPGELISVHGFEVDTQSRESIGTESKSYLARFVTLDMNLRRVDSVPDNRTIYLAVSFSPEYINTGIVTAVRGEYMTDNDPLDRLDPDVAQNIADSLGIASSDLKYLSRANIGHPVIPTQAMKDYVNSDDHEIIANLPTVSVDEKGMYVIPVTLSSSDWELLKDKDISDYKIYALNDSDLGDEQLQTSFILGLLNTWEIYSLSGKKMDSFSLRDFFLVGFLDSGQPFSLYVARLLLSILSGGTCSTGIFSGACMLALVILFIW